MGIGGYAATVSEIVATCAVGSVACAVAGWGPRASVKATLSAAAALAIMAMSAMTADGLGTSCYVSPVIYSALLCVCSGVVGPLLGETREERMRGAAGATIMWAECAAWAALQPSPTTAIVIGAMAVVVIQNWYEARSR